MSKIGIEDSPFQQILDNASEALFGVLYNLQKTRKDDLVRLNLLTGLASILLEFIQILPFFVHGYNWGTITLTWGRYARYIQLQLQLTTWESYNVRALFAKYQAAFWASVVLVALILIVSGICFYSLYNKNTPHPVASTLMNLSYNVVLHILFIAGFKLLMTPWWCNPATQKLFPFEDVDCFAGSNLINLIVGSVFALLLLSIMFLSSFSTVNLAPVPNDLFAVTTPIYRIAFYCTLVFMTINENLIAKVIADPGNGNQIGAWWEALFNLIVMTGLFAVVVYYLPFQVAEGNLWRGGLIASCLWVAACTFVVINYDPNPDKTNHIIDYVTLGGILPAFALGYYIIQTRYLVFKSLATALIQEVEENFLSNELYRAKYGSKAEDLIVGGDRNPYIYLPTVLQKFGANVTTIEITGRMMWYNSNAKENVEASYRMYRKAEQAFPDLAYVKYLRANCFTCLSADPSAFIDQIEGAKKLDPGFLVQFLIYKRDMEIKHRGSMTKKDGDNSSDIVTYVEFQKYYAEAQKYNRDAIASIRLFWELFLQSNISFTAFNKAARSIEINSQKALSTYKTLLLRYPKHIYIISSYAYFLELVLHNAEEAERYHRRADQLRARENDETGLSEGGIDSQAVISISEEGTIEQVNNAVTNFFGYARIELLSRNIKLIVPSPYKERHDQFLDRYKATGDAKVIGLPPRKLFGQHRDGYSFAINLQVAERRKENGDRAYLGTLVQVDMDVDHGVIIINEDGMIILVTKQVTKLFGYSAVELLRNNITMCMIDAFAANHESYLRRYKETGEAKVIGTAGRNVPARRKDSTVFPASLVVEELYIGSDRYYMAQIRDTTHVTAIIYIDGFGTVQNCDQGISILLGYRKEDLVGQNIKGVMPPPYNQYHDMYLERYRRTKVSNILRSTEGRLLPALHADGSVVKIRAIVQKSDTGSDNLLFKGIIRRVDDSLKNDPNARTGFDDVNVIEMKKDGTIISVSKSILNTLSYSTDKNPAEYVGQPIEVLIPPVESRPKQQRSVWMAQALAQPDLNFYICLLAKNYTLFPFAYNLMMKSSDVVLMRVRDVLATDALITIDEIGTILSSNEDTFLLLGHEPDEILGRNIKYIQAPEVAEQHDGYLLRYKETRVARVVGIARQISTIHRDQSVIPIEIQVIEQKTADGNNFIGRLRHLQIEDRVPHEFVQSFYKTVANDENIFVNFAEEQQNPFELEAQEINVTASQANSQKDDEEADEESDSSSSSSEDEEEKENLALNAEVEDKLSKLRLVEKENNSTRKLGCVLVFTFAALFCTFLAGLISANVAPHPKSLYIFLDKLSKQSVVINSIIFAVRLGIFEEEAMEIVANFTNTPGSEEFWECSLGEPYTTKGGKTVPLCPFVKKFSVKGELVDALPKLIESQNWFVENYPKIRADGDVLDVIFTAQVPVKSYENGMMGLPTTRTYASWADLIGAGFFDAVSKLSLNPVFDGSELAPRLDFQFIQGNRNAILSRLAEIQEGAFSKIESLLATEALIHLVIMIISIVIVGSSFFIFMIPAIRQVMADRILILKLLLLVPKSVVWDFVYTIYRDDSEDEENLVDGEVGDTEKAREEAKAKAMKLRSEDAVDIIADNAYQLYIFYGVGMFTVILPVLIHVIWRYTFNAAYSEELYTYHEVSFLYTTVNSLLWRAVGLLAPCSFRLPKDQSFCSKMAAGSQELTDNTKRAFKYFNSLQKTYAGNDEVDELLYSVEQLTEVYKSCKEESEVKIDVDRVKFPKYDWPKGLANGDILKVKEKEFRCNDEFHVHLDKDPYELQLPHDYSNHFTKGIGTTLSILFQNAFAFAEATGFNVTSPPTGPVKEMLFWNIFEASTREATEGIQYFKAIIQTDLIKLYDDSRTAFNATYIVSLVYLIILFGWVFEGARKDLAKELVHNRGFINMIPISIVSKSKPIVEFVERTLHELVG